MGAVSWDRERRDIEGFEAGGSTHQLPVLPTESPTLKDRRFFKETLTLESLLFSSSNQFSGYFLANFFCVMVVPISICLILCSLFRGYFFEHFLPMHISPFDNVFSETSNSRPPATAGEPDGPVQGACLPVQSPDPGRVPERDQNHDDQQLTIKI